MPYMHMYFCTNPVECRREDLKVFKLRQTNDRNWRGQYCFASYIGLKYYDNYWWW